MPPIRLSFQSPQRVLLESLSAAGSVFAGGALETVSLLQRYTTTTDDLTRRLAELSRVCDVNRGVIFDRPDTDTMELPLKVFAVFTKGEKAFRVETLEKKTLLIKEQDLVWCTPADAKHEACFPSLYRLALKEERKPNRYMCPVCKMTSSKPGRCEKDKVQFSNRWVSDWVYPCGEDAYVILTVEKYRPYTTDLCRNPEQVPGVRDNFRSLDYLLAQRWAVTPGQRSESTKAHEPVADQQLKSGSRDQSPAKPEKPSGDKWQAIVDTEGLKLIKNLQILADTGDVSLADARTLVEAFIARAANTSGSQPGFDGTFLRLMSRCFDPPSDCGGGGQDHQRPPAT